MADPKERMADLLRFANYRKIGDELGVGRAAVQKWAKGINVGPDQVRRVEELYGRTFGGVPAEQEPAWVEGAVTRAVGSVRAALLDPAITDEEARRLARLFARVLDVGAASGVLPQLLGAGTRTDGDQSDDDGA